MRSRNIKIGFWENEVLGSATHTDRLLFIGLWCLADRDGKLEDRPNKIKHLLFGYDTKPVNVEKSLCNLMSLHVITRYTVDGTRYIHIPNFKKHQTPHPHEAASKIPDPVMCRDMSLHATECQADILIPDIRNPDNRTMPSTAYFSKPTIEAVRSYCKERGGVVDPEKWFNYYESNGWKVGKNSMKNWQAAVRTWEKNGFAKNGIVENKKLEVIR